jgi:hypothetical protein
MHTYYASRRCAIIVAKNGSEISQGKKGKSKPIPLQAWTDPEGSGSLRFPDFKTIGT